MSQHNAAKQKEDCLRCSHPISSTIRTEMDTLKQRLIDRELTIVQLETQMTQNLPDNYSQTQLSTLRSRCDYWQDKYDRLLEAHKRIQRVNQGLEDKLLRLVDRTESEKARLTSDSSNLTTALTTAAQAINRLKQQNERYRNDLNLAIQLLQCNSSQYGAHKLQTLPVELQQQVKSKLQNEPTKGTQKTEMKVIKVPIPTFPPTAMVYSVNKYEEKEVDEGKPVDVVSAAIMAAVLEERQRERTARHCPTCTCGSSSQSHSSHSHPDQANKSQTNHHYTSGALNNNGPVNKNTKKSSLRVVDVGTQTVPSYIGQSGKVTSTCIYCHSSKTSSSENINLTSPCKGMDEEVHMITPSKGKRILRKSSLTSPNKDAVLPHRINTLEDAVLPHRVNTIEGMTCPWDWSLESQDSGSPSTPTSLTSASLSYESEASSFTSPQESPGRATLSLPNKSHSFSKGEPSLNEDSQGHSSSRLPSSHGDHR